MQFIMLSKLLNITEQVVLQLAEGWMGTKRVQSIRISLLWQFEVSILFL